MADTDRTAPRDLTDREAVRAIARSLAVDRYLSALLGPREVRDDLVALAAFLGEIERVPVLVSEAALGEIRLQWWLDWLAGLDRDKRSGNPVADRFGAAVSGRGLSREDIGRLIEARTVELYSQPFANDADLIDFLDETEGIAMRLAARICGARSDADEDWLGAAARAYGAARQLVRLPYLVRRGRWGLSAASGEDAIAADELGEAKARAGADAARSQMLQTTGGFFATLRATQRPAGSAHLVAGLPAAMTEPYLAALQGGGDWLREPVDISPLARAWRLWWTRTTGRF